MKKFLYSAMALIVSAVMYAQAPPSFTYQAVLRDASGTVIANTGVLILIEILQGSATGTQVFTETHNTSTNAFGLVNLEVGSINTTGLETIDWTAGPYFVKISVDGTEMGTSQLLSVPYALYSENAGSSVWESDGDDIYYSDGNVGIGTSDPVNALHVQVENNGLNIPVFIQNNNGTETGGNAVGIGFNNEVGGDWIKAAVVHERMGGYGTGTLHILVDDADDNSNVTLSDSRMSLTREGNVGIGVTSPTEKLEVNGMIYSNTGGYRFPDGSVQITSATGGGDGDNDPTNELITGLSLNGTNLEITDAGGTNTVDLGSLEGIGGDFSEGGEATGTHRTLGNTDNYNLGFITNNQNRLQIKNNGYLGVGTTDPTECLDINGNLRVRWGNISLGGSTPNLGKNGDYIFLGNNNNLVVHTSGTYQGRVGIGVTEPLECLDIAGKVYIRSAELLLGDFVRLKSSSNYFSIGYNDEMVVHTNGTLSGNVGIGTIEPLAKLEVSTSSEISGILGRTSHSNGKGVEGRVSGGNASGVHGLSTGQNGHGISGKAEGLYGRALYGEASGVNGVALYGTASGANSIGVYADGGEWAGYFENDVMIEGSLWTGNIFAGAIEAASIAAPIKMFCIDHPLYPNERYLKHASIESSEILNLYTGTVTLNESGEAWVELANWFEALNKDFTYQLTCINACAPVYIAEKIKDNKFKIAGGQPGMEISWQVTGIRHDTYAIEHPLEVEQDK